MPKTFDVSEILDKNEQGNKLTYMLRMHQLPKTNDSEGLLSRIKSEDDMFSRKSVIMQEGILTNREKEVCCLVKDGYSDAEMASRLYISLHTVRTHIKNIHHKLEVKTRAKLVALLNKPGETKMLSMP